MAVTITSAEPNPIDTDKSFTVPLNDKYSVTFTAHDPYGFLDATMNTGPVPSILSGSFTSPKEARLAVKKYLSLQSEVSNGRQKKVT